MSDLTRELDITLKELAVYGIKGVVEEAGKHFKVQWQHAAAYGHMVCARSGSDRRGWLNARGEVRRQMREAGILPLPPEPVTSFKRAMELPKVEDQPPHRLKELEQDFAALLDLFVETRTALTAAVLEVETLREKLMSATVQSQLIFQRPAEPAPAPVHSYAYIGGDKRTDKVMRTLPTLTFMNLEALSAATNLSKTNLSSALDYLKKQKKVEKGPRGYWRRLPDPSLNGAGTTG